MLYWSRWGRFNDIDEAAHYVFIGKRAGLEVHYCAGRVKVALSGLVTESNSALLGASSVLSG